VVNDNSRYLRLKRLLNPASQVFVQSRGDIVEVEINPLILRAEDHGAVAVDALITIKPH
jgi:succinyl-CoA synthetase beta subunit